LIPLHEHLQTIIGHRGYIFLLLLVSHRLFLGIGSEPVK
jgi:hypothetical protein